MVAWYPLDELTGTTSANLASGNTGLQVNGPLGIPDGIVAGAAHFDGFSQYISSPSTISTNFGYTECGKQGAFSSCPPDFSIDVWVRVPAYVLQQVNEMVIVDHRGGGGNSLKGYSFFLDTEPFSLSVKMGLQMADGGSAPGYSNYFSPDFPLAQICPPIFCDVWHHLAVTVQRTKPQGITWYVDGSCLGGSTCTTSNPTDREGSLVTFRALYIGTNSPVATPPQGYYSGDLDELEIHNRVLAPQEISAIYNSGFYEGGKCKP